MLKIVNVNAGGTRIIYEETHNITEVNPHDFTLRYHTRNGEEHEWDMEKGVPIGLL